MQWSSWSKHVFERDDSHAISCAISRQEKGGLHKCIARFITYSSPGRADTWFPSLPRKECTGVRYVITKFSRMDGLPNFLTHGAPLARFARKLRYYCTFGCACHRTLQIYYRWISWILEMSVIFFNTSSNGRKGNKGGAVVRALASHQCGLGSNPRVNAICGLNLLLVLSLVPRGFSSFSSLLKNQHLQIPIRSWTHGHVWTSS